MVSKTFSFKLSSSLIKEDLRRFWTLSVFSLIGYFLSGVFIVLVQYNASKSTDSWTVDDAASFIDSLLSGSYPIFTILTVVTPVIAAAFTFGYLYTNGEVLLKYSQPFTRTVMINSHALSALLLCFMPLVVTASLLLILVHPVYYSESYYSAPSQMTDLYTSSRVLRWFLAQTVCMLFVLSISVFSSVVTGMRVHQIAAAIGFNMIVPATAAIFILYEEAYLFGFDAQDGFNFVLSSSPVLYPYCSDHTGSSVPANLIYLAVGAAIFALSVFLYNIRKLERTGRGVVFDAAEWIIVFVFGLIGMTVVGLTFKGVFGTSPLITVIGYAVGALAAMAVCLMAVKKQLNIFNKHTLCISSVFMVFMFAFLGIMLSGGLGFTSRIPSNPGSVTVRMSNLPPALSDSRNYISYFDTDSSAYSSELDTINFTKKDDINAVEAFHSMIIENEDKCGIPDQSYNFAYPADKSNNGEDMVSVEIEYHRSADAENSPATEVRTYSVPQYLILNGGQFEQMFNSHSYRYLLDDTIKKLSASDITHAKVFNSDDVLNYNFDNGFDIPEGTKLSGLISALREDAENISYDEYVSTVNKDAPGIISFYQESSSVASDQNASKSVKSDDVLTESSISGLAGTELSDGTIEINIVVQPYCTETLKWLSDNLGIDLMSSYGSYYDAVLIHKKDGGSVERYTDDINSEEVTIDDLMNYASEKGIDFVTDQSSVQHDFQKSVSHSVFGSLADLSTEKDDVYYAEFFTTNEDGSLYNAYNAYIKGSDIQR